jgi:hypothetical protein
MTKKRRWTPLVLQPCKIETVLLTFTKNAKIVAAAEGGNFNITDLSVTEPTLENVFINLTGKELRD